MGFGPIGPGPGSGVVMIRPLRLASVNLRNGLMRALSENVSDRPAPIPLEDVEAQKEFERLQRQFAAVTETLVAQGETGFSKEENPHIDENGRNRITGEHNGPRGKEPIRYGDWERKGRVSDF